VLEDVLEHAEGHESQSGRQRAQERDDEHVARHLISSAGQSQEPRENHVCAEGSDEGDRCAERGVGPVGADDEVGPEDHVAKRHDDQDGQNEFSQHLGLIPVDEKGTV